MQSILLPLILAAPPQGARVEPAAPPALKVPAEVRGQPAQLIEVAAETEGKVVRWVCLTPGLSTRTLCDGKTLLVSGMAGRFELLAYTALGDVPSEPARCVVVIEGGPAPPPPDELKARLAAALEKDDPESADVQMLAALYRVAATVSLDPEVSSSQELLRRLREATASELAGKLTNTRTLVSEELLKLAGMSGSDAMTDAQRKRLAEFFTRAATLLAELAG